MATLNHAYLARQTEEDVLYPVNCRACGRYLGVKVRADPGKLRMYCADDPWCAVTREWVWPKDAKVDALRWLVEYEGIPVPQLARELDESPNDIHSWMRHRQIRALRARM